MYEPLLVQLKAQHLTHSLFIHSSKGVQLEEITLNLHRHQDLFKLCLYLRFIIFCRFLLKILGLALMVATRYIIPSN